MDLVANDFYYLIDLDGVLTKPDPVNQPPTDLDETDEEFWDFYYDRILDEIPNLQMINFINQGLAIYNNPYKHMSIIIHTARPERFRTRTIEWFKKHNITYDSLVMREDGDFSFDDDAKEKSLKSIIQVMNKKPIAVFEDRPELVRMYRKHGLLVLQV